MPRVKTTKTMKIALIFLRIYLLFMLVLVVVKFVMTRHPPPGP